jgi:hypothetical protein
VLWRHSSPGGGCLGIASRTTQQSRVQWPRDAELGAQPSPRLALHRPCRVAADTPSSRASMIDCVTRFRTRRCSCRSPRPASSARSGDVITTLNDRRACLAIGRRLPKRLASRLYRNRPRRCVHHRASDKRYERTSRLAGTGSKQVLGPSSFPSYAGPPTAAPDDKATPIAP